MRHAVWSSGRSGCRRGEFAGQFRRKQRMRDDGVDRWWRRPRRAPCAQAISVPPDDTMSSTSRAGRPANSFGSAKAISTERSPRRVLRATACVNAEPAGEIAHPGLEFGIGTDHDRARIECRPRADASAMAGMADRSSASMPGKTSSMSCGAVQMSVDRDDPVEASLRSAGR